MVFRFFKTEAALFISLLKLSMNNEPFSCRMLRSFSSTSIGGSLDVFNMFPFRVTQFLLCNHPNAMVVKFLSSAASFMVSSTVASLPSLINARIRRLSGSPFSACSLPSALNVIVVCFCSWTRNSFFVESESAARITAACAKPLALTIWSTGLLPPSFSNVSNAFCSFSLSSLMVRLPSRTCCFLLYYADE